MLIVAVIWSECGPNTLENCFFCAAERDVRDGRKVLSPELNFIIILYPPEKLENVEMRYTRESHIFHWVYYWSSWPPNILTELNGSWRVL